MNSRPPSDVDHLVRKPPCCMVFSSQVCRKIYRLPGQRCSKDSARGLKQSVIGNEEAEAMTIERARAFSCLGKEELFETSLYMEAVRL